MRKRAAVAATVLAAVLGLALTALGFWSAFSQPESLELLQHVGRRLGTMRLPVGELSFDAAAGGNSPEEARASFGQWMANAGLYPTASDSVAGNNGADDPLFAKEQMLLRVLAFCYDVLPASVRARFAHDFVEVEGIVLEAKRPLTEAERSLKRLLEVELQVANAADAMASSRFFSAFTSSIGAGGNRASASITADTGAAGYYRFLPAFIAQARLGQPAAPWETPCWGSVTAQLVQVKSGVQLQVRVAHSKHIICADSYLFLTPSGVRLGLFPAPIGGSKRYTFLFKGLTESEVWDVQTHGVRIFRFGDSPLQTVVQILETALLFLPLLTRRAVPLSSQRNADFLQRYSNVTLAQRHDMGGVMVNESEIHSGDFIGILRLDGLDPMLAWATGAHTGHTTVAVWEEGQLYVAESTVNTSYWPSNGIQRTPYRQWLEQARAAGYNVVLAPLAPKYRQRFNATAANEFFRSVEGLQYGYGTIFSGWIDTEARNYPCTPPYDINRKEEKRCLTWKHFETGVAFALRYIKEGESIFLPAWNMHVTGSAFTGLSFTELYRSAEAKGMELSSIPAVVESDWTPYPSVYNNGTSGPGLSMVCDVFVCMMWKAGGIFKEIDDDFNCVEQTNNDIYQLSVLSPPQNRPASCVAADPDNRLCQLMGKWQLHLPKLDTRDMYRHMQEHCPTEPPVYERPGDC